MNTFSHVTDDGRRFLAVTLTKDTPPGLITLAMSPTATLDSCDLLSDGELEWHTIFHISIQELERILEIAKGGRLVPELTLEQILKAADERVE